jgi:hypothetical protein
MLDDPLFGSIEEDDNELQVQKNWRDYGRLERVQISADGLLFAVPVYKLTEQLFATRVDAFNETVLNIKPAIFSGCASEWFEGKSGETKLGLIKRRIKSDDSVCLLVAKDGKNFLKHELCSEEIMNLSGAISEIMEPKEHSTSTDSESKPERVRKYLRIYISDHMDLAQHVDLSFLSLLAFSRSESADCIEASEIDSNGYNVARPTLSGFNAKNIGVWFSMAGCITPLHFDICHGFLAQIIGYKTFILASAHDPILRRYWEKARGPGGSAEKSRNASTSPIDLNRWLECDKYVREQFPLIDEVTWFIASLGPGDILYTPPGWWHFVVSDTNSLSVLVPFDPVLDRDNLPLNVQSI